MSKTLQSFFLAAGLAFGSVFAIHGAMAQDLPDDFDGTGGFEVEENRTGRDWGQYIGGRAGVVMADGDTISRQLAALQLDINLPASDTLKSVVSVDVADFENSYKQELRDDLQRNLMFCDELSPNAIETSDNSELWETYGCDRFVNREGTGYIKVKRETPVSDIFVDFREAYVQWEATDATLLRVGRQILVWGQFDFFSPNAFLAPTRSSSIKPRAHRSDLSFAQDMVQLSVFPLSNLEVQAIYVPQMRIDPAQRDGLEIFATRCDEIEGHFVGAQACDDGLPDIAAHDMSVLRFVYEGDGTSFAITALQSVDTWANPLIDMRLVESTPEERCGTTPELVEGVIRERDKPFCLTDVGKRAYYETEAFGLEFSRRVNERWTLLAEYTVQDVREDIDLFYLFEDYNINTELGNLIVTQADGRPYFDATQRIVSIGGVYEGDVWRIGLQLLGVDIVPNGGVDTELERAEEAARGDDEDDEGGIAPLFQFSRTFGDDGQGYAGFGAGAFFNSYGFGIFGGWTFAEKIQIGGLLGVVADVADNSSLESGDYETVDDGDALVQIGVSYLF